MKNNLETKHSEIVIFTSDIAEMKGKYTAKKVIRKWFEDFKDEDTGEVVSIERKEIILDKGVLLDDDTLPMVNFHLQAGDIEGVEVSNQRRTGQYYIKTNDAIWCVSLFILNKVRRFYLYAHSPEMAIDIAKDYAEQYYDTGFRILGVKEINDITLITNISQDERRELKFYNLKLEVMENVETLYEADFIVKSTDAESGKGIVEAFIKKQYEEEDEPTQDLQLTILSAKTVNIETIIDYSFCEKYLEENAETH